jgi:hypothetical protein
VPELLEPELELLEDPEEPDDPLTLLSLLRGIRQPSVVRTVSSTSPHKSALEVVLKALA